MKRPIQLSDHFTYRKLLQFVFPSIVMMIFTSIYGVVDGLFVSNYAGKTAFAAINLVMPFIMVLGGIGFMIGTGGTALVSKILGEGDQEKARRYFSMMILFTVLVGLILTVLGVVFMEPVALFLGATPEMLADCVLYGRIVNAFTAAFMLQNVFQSFLIAAEKPKLGLAATVAAGVTNMVLDALFIAVFHWGIAGAATATGLSQCVGGLFPLLYFLRPNTSKLCLVRTKLELQPILNACGNGSSELMSNISSSIVSMVYNFQLLKYLGEDGVSAYGVLMYVQFVFVAIYIGYSIGCAPIVGFHYGAQNHPELKKHAAHERHPDERLRRRADGTRAGTGRAAGEDLRRVRRGTVHADVPCVPAVFLCVFVCGIQHFRLVVLYCARQRADLCGHFVFAHAGVPDVLRHPPAPAPRRRRHLVRYHRRRDLRHPHLHHLPAGKTEKIPLYVSPWRPLPGADSPIRGKCPEGTKGDAGSAKPRLRGCCRFA